MYLCILYIRIYVHRGNRMCIFYALHIVCIRCSSVGLVCVPVHVLNLILYSSTAYVILYCSLPPLDPLLSPPLRFSLPFSFFSSFPPLPSSLSPPFSPLLSLPSSLPSPPLSPPLSPHVCIQICPASTVYCKHSED